MSVKWLYLFLALGVIFTLSGIATARVHHMPVLAYAPADAGMAEAEPPVAPGDPADLLAPMMKWLAYAVTILTFLNAVCPWPAPESKWYKARQFLALAQGAIGHAAAGRGKPAA